jgi:hypothetical protein
MSPFGSTFVPFGTNQDDIAWDMALFSGEAKLFVGGYTCPIACAAGDDSPESDFALARLELGNGDLDSFDGDGKRDFSVGYTDVGYSIILQPQPAPGFPKLLIGGYSATNDGGTPFMSGGRILFDGSGTPDTFRSAFGGIGTRGDQAWELRVQASNNRIVAGGFHTRGVQNGGPTFAALRICKDPAEDPCDASGIPSGGGNIGAPDRSGMFATVPRNSNSDLSVLAQPGTEHLTPEVPAVAYDEGAIAEKAPLPIDQRRTRGRGEEELFADLWAWPSYS